MTASATPIPEGKYAVIDGGLSIHCHEAGTSYVLGFFVEALHGLVAKLGIERCPLLGNSLDGAIKRVLCRPGAHSTRAQSLVSALKVSSESTLHTRRVRHS